MSYYSEENLLFLLGRRCHFCRQKLSNPVIAEDIDWENPNYYCNKECAKKQAELEKARLAEEKALNDYIKGNSL